MRRRTVGAGAVGPGEQEEYGSGEFAPSEPAVASAPAPAPVAQPLRTEFEFELPRGYVDPAGAVHRRGSMRLATARDELMPLIDLRVKNNPAYLTVVLLGTVITRLGTVVNPGPDVVEELFASDLAFLQDFYRRINAEGHTRAAVTCPSCSTPFEVDLAGGRLGES
ncbi:hypothetical protein ACFW1A_32605 [Kitasatospora sp. NPDC058965]|uniref:hypothetical protein n=1 Tax=Kitasatospora sp. NPDC058965 TaxID=3346682 RepID=UPI0036C2EAF3